MDIASVSASLGYLNNSRLFSGIAMIIMNLGSRYIITDLTKAHEKFMTSRIFKKVILFSMFFVGTRDVLLSCILTFAFTVTVNGFLNETRKYNLLPKSSYQPISGNDVPKISEADYHKAREIVQLYESNKKTPIQQEMNYTFKDKYNKGLDSLMQK